MLSTNTFLKDFDIFKSKSPQDLYMKIRHEDGRIRIISGPVEKTAKFDGKEYMRYNMVVIDRKTSSVKILSAGKMLYKQLLDCIQTMGDPINYDIDVHVDNKYQRFYSYKLYPNSPKPLSDEDVELIRTADVPDEFKITKLAGAAKKRDYNNLLVIGAQFRITNKAVMMTDAPGGRSRNLFGDEYPPCLIRFVDKDRVIIGRQDWDFDVPVDRDVALKKFSTGSWVPVKTLIERDPIFCNIHKTFLPYGEPCCEPQALTEGSIRVIF
jgi:hypothetical protein